MRYQNTFVKASAAKPPSNHKMYYQNTSERAPAGPRPATPPIIHGWGGVVGVGVEGGKSFQNTPVKASTDPWPTRPPINHKLLYQTHSDRSQTTLDPPSKHAFTIHTRTLPEKGPADPWPTEQATIHSVLYQNTSENTRRPLTHPASKYSRTDSRSTTGRHTSALDPPSKQQLTTCFT